MILAAGRGERMRPLTDSLPKPLLEVRGKPMIVWTIEALARAGVTDIVINHAHLGAMIEQRLGDGVSFGVRIRYSPEGTALETAGGIAKALPLLGPHPFIVANGDLFCGYDFARLVQQRLAGKSAHLVLVPNPPHHPNGDFGLLHGRVTSAGQATKVQATPLRTFAGIGLYDPELFAGIASGSRAPLAPLLIAAMDEGRVTGELFEGEWHDVGTPERLAELNG